MQAASEELPPAASRRLCAKAIGGELSGTAPCEGERKAMAASNGAASGRGSRSEGELSESDDPWGAAAAYLAERATSLGIDQSLQA